MGQEPDATLAKSLLRTANGMISQSASRAKLRRAISTSYYAVFHALAKECADCLVGNRPKSRSNKAWVEVYRGLAHGPCKDSCSRASNVAFPEQLHNFADAFVQLQEARHRADYDPTFDVSKSGAEFYLSLAQTSVQTLDKIPKVDMTAFAAWVLITTRGAKEARKQARQTNHSAS